MTPQFESSGSYTSHHLQEAGAYCGGRTTVRTACYFFTFYLRPLMESRLLFLYEVF